MAALRPDKLIPTEEFVVTKAVARAAKDLGISNQILSDVLGVPEASISQMASGTYELSGKPFELAVLLIRLYRSLDAIVGGDMQVAQSWLANDNLALNAVPLQHIRKIAGLNDALSYLDARRAVV